MNKKIQKKNLAQQQPSKTWSQKTEEMNKFFIKWRVKTDNNYQQTSNNSALQKHWKKR